MQKLTARILALGIAIISMAAVGCSKKVDGVSLPQTLIIKSADPTALTNGYFSVKTPSDFTYTPDPLNDQAGGFQGSMQSTGSDSLILYYEYGANYGSSTYGYDINVTDSMIKADYKNNPVIEKPIINGRHSVIVTYTMNGVPLMDLYMFNTNTNGNCAIIASSNASKGLTKDKQDVIKKIFTTFQFIQ